MATVGVYTIEDLWEKFGDLKMPPVREQAIGLIFIFELQLRPYM